MTKTGIHNIPFDQYHALEAWGAGSLRAMRRGPPARVMWEKQGGKADTAATILGSAVHCALITPELFGAEYAVKPEGMTFASKEGKAWRDDPIRTGCKILSHDDGATMDSVVHALRGKIAVAASLESATHREVSLVWDCSSTGELCKARPDWIEGGYIYDLKVSRHASGGWLAARAFSEGWMSQLAHYRSGAIELGLAVTGGRLVVVEPIAPHFVYTLEVKEDALDLLELENIETRKRLRECRMRGVFPGTPDQWVLVEPPAGSEVLIEELEEVA